MYRRVVLSNDKSIGNTFSVLYHVVGANLLSQRRISTRRYDTNFSAANEFTVAVFADSVRLQSDAWIGDYRTYEFILDVSENQPDEEAVEEITSTGITITVYNEHGVLICRNTPKTPANGDTAQTVGPGEMTSVPGEEPGEMAGETTDEPGATI